MPEEAACQPHLPARKESPEHMDGGKNQMREMRLCAHVGALNGILYMRCTVHADSKACPGCGCVKLHELEAVVYGAMVKKLKDFKTLTGRKKRRKSPRSWRQSGWNWRRWKARLKSCLTR